MTDTRTAELDTGSIADDYRCDECVYSLTLYTNNKACHGCDGSNNLVPRKEKDERGGG